MTAVDWLPLAAVAAALGPGLVIAFLGEDRHRLRTALNLTAAGAQMAVVVVLIALVAGGGTAQTRIPFVASQEILLQSDAPSLLLAGLSASLWLLTTIYAVGYLEDEPHRSRFFGFFSLCVSATLGVALAGNLFTFFLFYELLTLATYPLVVHRGDEESVWAGQVYLGYTACGGLALLGGMVWLQSLTGPVEFATGGSLDPDIASPAVLAGVFWLLIAGMGVKAALFPLHGWLPIAMVAPAPVSALLHAVAVVKAGAFGIVRVVHNIFGPELTVALGLGRPLALLAGFTIVYGSVHALFQDHLKRRLAYSTVSQVAYITLGVALGGSLAAIGGLVHIVHQGLMKITLFFCAGAFAHRAGIHRVSEMAGIGRSMPGTMGAFTIGALGMIGAPPVAGFVTKWHLGLGGLQAGEAWVVPVLVTSGLLNAWYFLPIVYAGWFLEPARAAEPSGEAASHPHLSHWTLLAPPAITAALALTLGILAGVPFGILDWAQRIAFAEYLAWGP